MQLSCCSPSWDRIESPVGRPRGWCERVLGRGLLGLPSHHWGSLRLQGKCAESRIEEAEIREPGVEVWGVNPVSSLLIDPMTQALAMSLRSG